MTHFKYMEKTLHEKSELVSKHQEKIKAELLKEGYVFEYGWTQDNCSQILRRLSDEIFDLASQCEEANTKSYTSEYRNAMRLERERRLIENILLA